MGKPISDSLPTPRPGCAFCARKPISYGRCSGARFASQDRRSCCLHLGAAFHREEVTNVPLRMVHRDSSFCVIPTSRVLIRSKKTWAIGNSRSSLVAIFTRTVAIPFATLVQASAHACEEMLGREFVNGFGIIIASHNQTSSEGQRGII